jgi:hypothetical protein
VVCAPEAILGRRVKGMTKQKLESLFAPFEENFIWQLQMAPRYAGMTIRQLKVILSTYSLPVSGLTLGLIERLEQSLPIDMDMGGT